MASEQNTAPRPKENIFTAKFQSIIETFSLYIVIVRCGVLGVLQRSNVIGAGKRLQRLFKKNALPMTGQGT
jgi:hypothetical protein